VIGGDLVVTAGARTLALMRPEGTGAVVNSHEIVTGQFTRNPDFRLPVADLKLALQARLRDRLVMFDASELARVALGDSIYSNMMVFGAAWQAGLIPVPLAAIREAIRINGAAVEANLRAFDIGRWAVAEPEAAARLIAPPAPVASLPPDPVAFREAHLRAYQDDRLARRYRAFVDRFAADPALREAVARGYHKLLAYKDEYEVARLHLQSYDQARAEFDGKFRMSFHLAPPLLPGKDASGRPRKREFGPWILPLFRVLARLKGLRGGPFDVFGYNPERRMERALIGQYEADMGQALKALTPATRDAILELALLPLSIRGFGPVKAANAQAAAKRRDELLALIAAGGQPRAVAAE
jgi:indolepyruvate ferredoxin oxidoreductase